MTRALLALALLGCAPGRLQLEPVSFLPVEGSEQRPAVFVGFPVDARPPADRLGGHFVYTQPLPTLYYGDIQLRPGALDAVDRTLLDALRAGGFSIATTPDEAELVVQPWVLAHRGVRDVADAHWVGLATAGTAGTVAQFLYPAFVGAEVHLRVEVRTREGALVTVRDVAWTAVRDRSLGSTRGLWYAYQRSPTREMFTEAFAEAHGEIGTEVARLVAEAGFGEVDAGFEPELPAQHFLRDRWDREPLPGRHASPRFSPITGHDTDRGDTIGKLGFPFDTIGYEVGVTDEVQALVNLTLLGLPRFEEGTETVGVGTIDTVRAYLEGDLVGLYNSATMGLRGQAIRSGAWALSVEGRAGTQLVFRETEAFAPRVASVTARGGLITSWQPGPATWFVRAGASHAARIDVFEEEPLVPGTRGLGAAGGELQLTRSAAVALELIGSARLDAPAPVTVYPQLTLGLR